MQSGALPSRAVTPVLAGVLAYVAAQLAIGFVVSRRIRTEGDYLLAGRSLGPALATASIFATWFGAETCVGAAGEVYANGIGAVSADPFGYGVCLILMGLVFAVPLWRRGLTTLADLFRTRFGPGVERAVALLMIPASIMWGAAQVRAFGHVLSASSDLDVDVGISIAAGVVIVYTVSGGLLADAITDLLQGGVLVVGLLVLFVAVVADAGGPGEAIARIDWGGAEAAAADATPWLATVNDWAVPILGSVLAQELVARVVASRSERVAKRSSLVAGGAYILVGLVPVALGLIGGSLVTGLDSPEQILPALAQRHLSSFGYVIFAGALVSAILSTVDSTLLVASGFLSHNLAPALRPDITDREKLRVARLGVVAFGIVAWAMAVWGGSVHDLVHEASAFGSAGITVAAVFGLFSTIGGTASAVAALVSGVVVWASATYVWEHPAAYVLAVVASIASYLVLARVRGPRSAPERQ